MALDSQEILRRLDALTANVEMLTKQLAARQSPSAPKGPRNPAKYPLWGLVRDYLIHAGPSTLRKITDALLADGQYLGRYPLRNVKISITSIAARTFFVSTVDKGVETISLAKAPVQYLQDSKRKKKPLPAKRHV